MFIMANRHLLVYFLGNLAFAASFPDSERVLKYVLKGDAIHLVPSIPGQPQVITWTRGDGRGVAFLDHLGEVKFPEYKNRLTLDHKTAELTIKDATYEDSGNYDLKLQINNKDHHLKYKIAVIDSERVLKYVLKGQEIHLVPPIFGQPDVIVWVRVDVVRHVVVLGLMGELISPEYKNRITLDHNTAELTIKNATYEDSGNYDLKLKINNEHHRVKYRIVVIDQLTAPNITCVMSGANQATLVCSTDSQHPHLLEFKWSSRGKEQPGQNLTITLTGELDDRVYRCDVSNPLTKQTATFTASKCFKDEPSDVENDIHTDKTSEQIVVFTCIIITITIIIASIIQCWESRKEVRDQAKKMTEKILGCQSKTIEREPLRTDEHFLTQKMSDTLQIEKYDIRHPNALWHLDSCDNLEPYGITIHGCIDGFTHHILWLEAEPVNGDPEVIANSFMKTVEQIRGCPQRLRADPRMENGNVKKMQILLRDNHTDRYGGERSFIDACSTTDQQMQSWLLIPCERSVEKWTNVFVNLRQDGHFTGSDLDKKLIQFCFLKLIKDNLSGLIQNWNSLQTSCKAVKDKLLQVPGYDINVCQTLRIPEMWNPCNEHCRHIMTENGWNYPMDEEAAVDLFKKMKNEMLKKNLSNDNRIGTTREERDDKTQTTW
ncbi:uncharacterized protein LOC144007899 isoform X2 [Festucalex cinctus]